MTDYEIMVTINTDDKLDCLADIIGCIEELADLIPDWNAIEAQKILDNISDKTKELLEVKK